MGLAQEREVIVQRSKWEAAWRLARPHQWSKNLVIFAALLFSQNLLHSRHFLLTVIAFAAFCALASFGYVINDIADREADRRHPEKRNRPLACGDLEVNEAIGIAAALAVAGAALSIVLGVNFALAGLLYLALQFSYSLYLKRIVIVDVIAIATGFVLRAFAGGVAINVEVSPWLIFITFVLALLLALTRRRHELVVLGTAAAAHRNALSQYNIGLIDQMISVVAGSTLVGYMIYTASPEVEHKLGTNRLYLTVPFVVLGILRYLYLVNARQEGGDPARLLLKDRTLLASVVLWVAADFCLLYL
jgi:4-hydroxybenzoate polyprenyltransferase